MAPRALVFDLDGTVWDSYPWLARVLASGSHDAEERALASLRDKVPAAKVLLEAGVTRARFRSLCAEARDFETYPGVTDTLSQLREDRIPLAVVTNLPSWIAGPMLDCLDLRKFFASVIDFRRSRPAKPNPAPIQASLAELGVEPSSEVWYVGDSHSDGEAANRAQVSFAWASYGYGGAEPANTAAVLATFSETLGL